MRRFLFTSITTDQRMIISFKFEGSDKSWGDRAQIRLIWAGEQSMVEPPHLSRRQFKDEIEFEFNEFCPGIEFQRQELRGGF